MAHTQQRAAIVARASRGIGAAIAGRLARDGLSVLVNYSGNADPRLLPSDESPRRAETLGRSRPASPIPLQ